MSLSLPHESITSPSVLSRLERYTIPEPNSGCWLWWGPLDGKGYGKLAIHRRDTQAYVITYVLSLGAFAKGLELDHLCRNHACVNPSHLEPVTRRINQIRGQGFAGVNARKTHCHNGHPFDAANTYPILRAGRHPGRDCRTCRREATARYEAKRREVAQ